MNSQFLLAVGTPSVASLVGGVPEYFHFGECGFSYRFEEYECLSNYVCLLFENDDLCIKFSNTAKEKSKQTDNRNIADKMIALYRELSNGVYK